MSSPPSTVVTPRSGTAREVLGFSAPLILSSLSMSMMWVVDTLIMGRVGTAEQGAVGLGGLLTWAMICLFTGTMSVLNVLVAQDYGAGRGNLARHVRTGLVCIVPMAIAIFAMRAMVPQGLTWLGATDAVRPHAQTYIQIRLYSSPFVLATFAITCYLRGLSDTITPMIVTLIANVVNGVLAAILVYGWLGMPALGVSGAAWATAIAAASEGLMYFGVFLFKPQSRDQGSRKLEIPSLADMRQFLGMGLPMGLSWLFETVAWTAFSAYASTRAPHELAAHIILFQAMGVCFMPAVAIGSAASTLVGQYMGARRPDLAWRSTWTSLAMGCGYMAVIGIVLMVFRRPFYLAFNKDPQVVALGCSLALVAGIYQPFDGFGIISQGVLRGAGKTATPTIVMLCVGFLVFVPLVYVLGDRLGLGVVGAWMAALAHVVLLSLILGVIILRRKWLLTKLVSDQTPLPVSRERGAQV